MILIGRGLDFRNDLESNWKHKLKNLGLQTPESEAVQLSGLRGNPATRKEEEKDDRAGPPFRLSWNTPKLPISGGNNEGVTPVPIPNTEVKPFSADGTWLVTARESRSPPDPKYNCRNKAAVILSLAGGPQPQWSFKTLGAGFALPFG